MLKINNIKFSDFSVSTLSINTLIDNANIIIRDKGNCDNVPCPLCFLSRRNNNKNLCIESRPLYLDTDTMAYITEKHRVRLALAKNFIEIISTPKTFKLDLTQ